MAVFPSPSPLLNPRDRCLPPIEPEANITRTRDPELNSESANDPLSRSRGDIGALGKWEEGPRRLITTGPPPKFNQT